MGPVDIRSFWKPAAKFATKLNESEPMAREENKENESVINEEKGTTGMQSNGAQLDADVEAELRILTAPSLKPMSSSPMPPADNLALEPILPPAIAITRAATASNEKPGSRQDESKAGSALDQALHGTNDEPNLKQGTRGVSSGDGFSGAIQTSSRTASLGDDAEKNVGPAPTSVPSLNAAALAATRALAGDRKELVAQLQRDASKAEDALSREVLMSHFFWNHHQHESAPAPHPQPSEGSSEGQESFKHLFCLNDTPSIAAFIEGQSCTLASLVEKIVKVAAAPPSSSTPSSQQQQADPAAVKAMVMELASRKNDYSIKKGSSDLLSASEDATEGVTWFWELRDMKKSLHPSNPPTSSHSLHTSPAPAQTLAPLMTSKDATRARKMIDLIRKRRKDLSLLSLSIDESFKLLSQSTSSTTFQPSKAYEAKLMKAFTKLHKSSPLDNIEESLRKGLEELGGRYQAEEEAMKKKMEEKEAKKVEKVAKKVEKEEEKKISKSGFGDKKSLDSARRVMTQFFGKTPVGKAPSQSIPLAFTPAPLPNLVSPEGVGAVDQGMPPPPLPLPIGESCALRSVDKGLKSAPTSITPQDIERMRREMDDLLSKHPPPSNTPVQAMFTQALSQWKSKRYQWTQRIKFVPPTWARRAQVMIDPAQHIAKRFGEGAVELEGDSANLQSWRRKYIQLSQYDLNSGIHYEANRPAYYGSFSSQTRLIRARKPLNKDTCLFDYDLDSDEEWEEEPEGEDLAGDRDQDEDEELDGGAGGGADGSVASQDPSGGFMVEDGYLSDDEGVVNLEDGATAEAAGVLRVASSGQVIDPRLLQIKHACDRASKSNRCLVALGPSAHRLVHTGGLAIDPRALEALRPIFLNPPTVKTPNPHTKVKLSRFEEYGIYGTLVPHSPVKAAAPPPPGSHLLSSGAVGAPSSSALGSGEGAHKGSGGGGGGKGRASSFPSELVSGLREFVGSTTTRSKMSTLVDNFYALHHQSSGGGRGKLTKKSIEDAIKAHAIYTPKSGLWTLKPIDEAQMNPPNATAPHPAPIATAAATAASLSEVLLPPGPPLTVDKSSMQAADSQGDPQRTGGGRQLFSTPCPVPLPPPPTPSSHIVPASSQPGAQQGAQGQQGGRVAGLSGIAPGTTPLLMGVAKRMRGGEEGEEQEAKKQRL